MASAHSQEDDEPVFPLTSELIGTIMGAAKPDVHVNAETARSILRTLKGLSAAHYTGCITFVYEKGQIQLEGIKSNIVYIGPAAK